MLDVIHQGERLERRIGSAATDAGEFARGSVESGHGRRGRGALDKRVKAAAVERVAVVLHVGFGVAAAEGDGFPDVDRLVGADRRAADFRAEETAERERLIAQNFGVEAEARGAGEQFVFRIKREQFRRDVGILAIGAGGDEQANEGFYVPAGAHELAGEPVEQLGMRRGIALRAEIAGRADEAGTKELLPKTIGDDARGERVFRINEPTREVEAGGTCAGRGQWWEKGGRGGGDEFAGFVVLAAEQDGRGVRRGAFTGNERGG